MKLFDKKNHHEPCPKCAADLVIKKGEYGAFKGCSRYPECDFIQPLKSIASYQVKVIEEKHCPKCGQFLALWQGRFGMFIACEAYPECVHTEEKDKSDLLSISCPQCQQGALQQRFSKRGMKFYACENYPECHFILNSEPIEGQCLSCKYPLLTKKRAGKDYKVICANKACAKPVE